METLTDDTSNTDRAIRLRTSDEVFDAGGVEELDVGEGKHL